MNLVQVSASLDEETGDMTLVFENTAPADYPDPVNWLPTRIVTLIVTGATVTDITPAPEQLPA